MPLGYPKEFFSTRSFENKNAKGAAAAKNEDILKWQKALDLLKDSGFQELFLEVGGGGQMVQFHNGEELPCCYNKISRGPIGVALLQAPIAVECIMP
jgi:hypothetical protein